jgi:serine/threonine-protein kinase HipA
MKKARVLVKGEFAGMLIETGDASYAFEYDSTYQGPAVSLTMPLSKTHYEFDGFPPFFEGLLPEGVMLEALLRRHKIDKNDYFTQLLVVGEDLVGCVQVEEDK